MAASGRYYKFVNNHKDTIKNLIVCTQGARISGGYLDRNQGLCKEVIKQVLNKD